MPTTTADVRSRLAEALFASTLQPSENPTPAEIHRAVRTSILRLSARGCAEVVAYEFGEHPVEAVRRMRWALDALRVIHPLHFGARDLRPRRWAG